MWGVIMNWEYILMSSRVALYCLVDIKALIENRRIFKKWRDEASPDFGAISNIC